MKRIITCIAILITAFAQTQAQHPRVCDYVSLKHALKGMECEVMRPASYYYNKDTADKGIAEIIIAKQRNGPIGTVNLVWMPQYTKFANMEKK